MSLCSINDQHEKQLMVIWDLGRRCTFACSYCPPHRKNNWSNLSSYEELVSTADSLERYSEIYNKYRDKKFRVSASFTGGEPTVNPDFFKFLEYLQEHYPHWKRTLTTNGFYSKRKLQTVMDNTNFTTLSYHCEGTEAQKKQVRENMQTMLDVGYNYKINIMFHEDNDYFNECIYLAQWCDDNGVPYTPRVIGDQGDVSKGIKSKTVHTYTNRQMEWLKNYWKAKEFFELKPAYYASNPPKPKSPPPGVMQMLTNKLEKKDNVGQSIGRPCCGGRQLDLTFEDGSAKQGSFVTTNNFQGWSCMVNWYFLYIHQEINKIWHHQTCQVNLEGNIGPISTVDNFNEYCDKLEAQFDTGSIPFIRCPKTHCGCGLCVPKAKDDSAADALFESHAPKITPSHMEMQDIDPTMHLKDLVYKFDKDNGNETI
jgi:organic radical activating enzyme